MSVCPTHILSNLMSALSLILPPAGTGDSFPNMGGWFSTAETGAETKEELTEEEKEKARAKNRETGLEHEAENVRHWFNAIEDTLLKVPTYSVKELKEKIELYSNTRVKQEPSFFLEKEEMRKTLVETIFNCLGPEELAKLNADIHAAKGESSDHFDRNILIDLILRPN